jgi:deoxyadenosine/deoxycytidine kinase
MILDPRSTSGAKTGMDNTNVATQKPEPGALIEIEGNIGSGKSTLGASLVAFLNRRGLTARFFPEYVHKPYLKYYIDRLDHWGSGGSAIPGFQYYMLAKRVDIRTQAIAYARTGGIAVVDRGPLGDEVFARLQQEAGKMTAEEMEIYYSIRDADLQAVDPDIKYHLLYLRTDTNVAFQRMLDRNREGESGYTIEYFETLNRIHDTMVDQSKYAAVVDWNEDLLTPGSTTVPDAALWDLITKCGILTSCS